MTTLFLKYFKHLSSDECSNRRTTCTNTKDEHSCATAIPGKVVDVTFYILLSLYFAITVLGIILAIKSAIKRSRRLELYKISLVLLPIATLSRGIDMATSKPVEYMTHQIGCHMSLKAIILGGICGHVFLATQMTFLLFWILTFFKIYARSTHFMRRVKQIYGTVVGLIVLLWTIVVTLVGIFDSDPNKKSLLHRVEVIYSSTICILVAIAFLLFGSKMYLAMRNRSHTSNNQQYEHKRVAFLTILSFTLFTCRASLTLVDMFITVSVVGVFIIRLSFLLLFEIIPAVILMILLSSTKKFKRKKNASINSPIDEEKERLLPQFIED